MNTSLSGLRVRPVESRSDLRRFIDFQYDLYRDNPHWIPPLRLDVKHTLSVKKNAFFDHGQMQTYLAEVDGGQVVGRIAAIVNGMHLTKYDDGVGFFGFFETIDRVEVATALIETAAGWLRSKGLNAMRGPANPSLNDVAGLLVDGFDRPPFVMMPYNKKEYQRFLIDNGFERVMTMWAYYINRRQGTFDKLYRGRDLIMKRNPDLRLRTIDMSRFDREAAIIRDIYNEAWSENWGHVPMTDREFAQVAKNMKQIVDPDLVLLIEDDRKPVAFAISLPNINEALRHVPDGRLSPSGLLQLLLRAKYGVNEVRTLLMGVRQTHRKRGLDAVLVAATVENSARAGYHAGELSWVLETNTPLINQLNGIGAVVDKEYAMFEKAV